MTDHDVMDLREMLQEQKRPEEKVPICLRGDLVGQLAELDRRLVELNAEAYGDDDRLTGNSEAVRVAQQYREVKAEADKYTVEVLLRAVTKKTWKDLVAKHPGGKDEDFNADKLFAELVPLSIVDVNGTALDPDTRDKLLDGLTEGQFDQLAVTAWRLNAGEGNAPKSVIASRLHRSSGETSEQPEPSE